MLLVLYVVVSYTDSQTGDQGGCKKKDKVFLAGKGFVAELMIVVVVLLDFWRARGCYERQAQCGRRRCRRCGAGGAVWYKKAPSG